MRAYTIESPAATTRLNETTMSLFTINGNPKLMKGNRLGYLSAVLHLAPAEVAGVGNVCPGSSPGCRAMCLNLAGRGGMISKVTKTNAVQEARKRKTREFMADKTKFMRQLIVEAAKLIKKAEKDNMVPCIRLNGTSDIKWETVAVDGKTIMEHFPDTQFYDYTKLVRSGLPANYHLTFSLSEHNEVIACSALNKGINVAVVFDTKKGVELPTIYELGGTEFKVIDGDTTDLRFLDTPGVIVGLRAKGPAKKDTSGFVRHV